MVAFSKGINDYLISVLQNSSPWQQCHPYMLKEQGELKLQLKKEFIQHCISHNCLNYSPILGEIWGINKSGG